MVESVQNMDTLNTRTDICTEGRVVWLEEENKKMVYTNGEWVEKATDPNAPKVEMNLYDINRQIISQLPDFTDAQWAGAEKVFSDWTANITNTYFLLYGREINYFTLFMRDAAVTNTLFSVMRECLENIGTVRSISPTEDKSAIEIWIHTNDDVTTCLYLFNYDDGVVKYNG